MCRYIIWNILKLIFLIDMTITDFFLFYLNENKLIFLRLRIFNKNKI